MSVAEDSGRALSVTKYQLICHASGEYNEQITMYPTSSRKIILIKLEFLP